jgi:hypothetical protein
MKIELLLDPNAEGFHQVQNELLNEINSLPSDRIRVTTQTVPPPPGTLVVDEVFRFVIEHKEEIVAAGAIAKTLIELVRAALGRRKGKPKDKKPVALIVVDDKHRLELPSSDERQRKLLRAVSGSEASTMTSSKSKPRGKRKGKRVSRGRK